MKKVLLLPALICLLLVGTTAQAQRYLTEVFTDVDVSSNVQYGENYSVLTGSPILQSLVMDVYEPNGDTETSRPLVVIVPTGSFLPRYINQLPTGDKSDSATVELCHRFARMGYVVACIDYRKGWNPQGTQDERTETIIQAVYRSMQDAKTAVRYFRMDATAQSNTYGIDPTRIVVGGQGSGGYTALAYATINDLSDLQLTKFFNFTTNAFMVDTALLGDWDGIGGNAALNNTNHPGYSSDVNMVFNIGGAIGDSTWISQGEIPIVSIHGINDAFAPYAYGIVNVPGTTLFVVDVSGSSDVIRICNDLGNNDVFFNPPISDAYTTRANAVNTAYDGTYGNGGNEGLFPIEGIADGNGPWEFWDDATVTAGATALGQDPATVLANGYASNPVYQALGPVAGKGRALAFIDTIQGYVAPRMYRVLFEVNSTPELLDEAAVSMYPNPTNDQAFISSDAENAILSVEIYNASGQLVTRENQLRVNNFRIDNSLLNPGFYLVTVITEQGRVTKKLLVQ